MQLDQAQKEKVSAWIAEGRQISDIQKLLESEFHLRMTYLEVRLLVDDLKLVPKDQKRPEQAKVVGPEPAPKPGAPAPGPAPGPAEAAPEPGAVSVSVDSIARPGSVVSGGVNFSDGQRAVWYIDQMGRLGLAPQQQGYRPSPEDLQEFQMQLQEELQRLGF